MFAMNNRAGPTETNPLIDSAVLDETWRAFDSRLRDNAIQSFAVAKRRRRVRRLAMQICVLVMVAGTATVLSFRQDPSSGAKILLRPSEPAAPVAPRSVITEQQMVDMFPPGTCLLAEVNGEKQLIFLDPKLAQRGFPVAAKREADSRL
jgi:hypothetical protein